MRREVTPGFMEVGDEQVPSGIRAFPVDFRLCSYILTPLWLHWVSLCLLEHEGLAGLQFE